MNKMFLVEKGKFVVIGNEEKDIGFNSFEDFYKYCPIEEFGIDLTDKNYIDYEPHRNYYKDDKDNNVKIPNNLYEYIIENIDIIIDRLNDPYYKVSIEEARDIKKGILKRDASDIILKKWPLFKQLNISSGIYDDYVKKEMQNNIKTIINTCDYYEYIIDEIDNIDEIDALYIKWPHI